MVDESAAEIDTPLAAIRKFVIAGWTGRDPEHVRRHIAELQEIGVKPPGTVPVFYEVSPAILTTSNEITAVGDRTSGEVEFVLVNGANGFFVTVGSDHTDRWLETISVHHSKQICAKPVAARAWNMAAVAGHWDQLILRSYSSHEGRQRIYQEGTVASMLAPDALIARYRESGAEFTDGTAMFCGTLALSRGIEYGDGFDIELEDPVRKRRLRHTYRVRGFPIAE